ncbi:MAG: molybdopterin molybdotransferase MoeA [Candidatus Baltobacteraceae bacterium]
MKERRFGFREENLLSPEDAIAAFFAAVALRAPQVELVALEDSYGRILGASVYADRDYPDAPRSAMDGFALASDCVPGRLPILGEIAMGLAWSGVLPRGSALRIPTGGVVPRGADAVVPIEEASFDSFEVDVSHGIAVGDNVNPRAGDMPEGELVLNPGTRVGGPQLGVLATLGITSVRVFRRPRIAVISSGDELIPPGDVPRIGQIRDSNRFAIAGSLRATGAEVQHIPTAHDEPPALETALADALEACDAVIVTGGSSVGDRDRTPDAIATLGAPGTIVHGLRVKPGKPTVLAAVGSKPVIGLPGNPTSALVILEAVAAPIIRALTGAEPRPEGLTAVLDAPVSGRPGWTWYVPVALRNEGATLVAHPLPLRSSMVSLTARCDGYLTIGERDEEFAAGTSVHIRRFA